MPLYEEYFSGEWKPVKACEMDTETSSPCFDCSICLDFARDPVVTLCGHLYCWPCIYKWIDFQTDKNPQCPVCKAKISHTSLVPLYGRGLTEPEGKSSSLGITVPPRPPASRTIIPNSNQQSLLYRSHEEDSTSPRLFSHGVETTTVRGINPNFGMFGEMVYARVFGNSESLYIYPNSYHYAGSSSARLRRQEMQSHTSLSRVTFFLSCCLFLCLLLF